MYNIRKKEGMITMRNVVTTLCDEGIATMPSDRFDYTLWRQEHFVGKMSPEELNEKAAAYAKENHVPPEGVKIS